jgi:hypothetical protein
MAQKVILDAMIRREDFARELEGSTLRQGLLELANARTTQAGQQSKADQVYQYLTGPRFKQRIEAIVERFKDMRDDIDKERKFMVKAWAKREAQVAP